MLIHDKKPMVFFHYEDSNDLFDSNVYAKGAVVMNMLRNILGRKTLSKRPTVLHQRKCL